MVKWSCVLVSDDDDGEYVPPPREVEESDDDDDDIIDDNDDDDDDDGGVATLDFDDEDCIGIVDVNPESRRVAEELLREQDRTEHEPKTSSFSREHIRKNVNRIYNRLRNKNIRLSDDQSRVVNLIKAVIVGVVDGTQYNADAVHFSFRLFFGAIREENLQAKYAWVCAMLVLPVVLTKLGAVKEFSTKEIVEAFEEMFRNPSTQKRGSRSQPRQGGYFWTFCSKDKAFVLVYIGESRQQSERYEEHLGFLQLASKDEYSKSWYPRASKQEVWRNGLLFDLTEYMDDLGFLGIFFQRTLEAAFCMIVNTLPAAAKETNGHLIVK